jgi:hypothetical protein
MSHLLLLDRRLEVQQKAARRQSRAEFVEGPHAD